MSRSQEEYDAEKVATDKKVAEEAAEAAAAEREAARKKAEMKAIMEKERKTGDGTKKRLIDLKPSHVA